MKTVCVSGGFDPLHEGHLDHIIKASQLGDYLLVLVSSDEDMVRKKGKCNIPLRIRIKTIELWLKDLGINGTVFASVDKDGTQVKTLKIIKPNIYAKGGDRVPNNMETKEIDVCNKIGCEIVYGIGNLLNASSKMIMRHDNKTISIVIPALNEEVGIIDTIRSVPVDRLLTIGYKPQIIVVNNGSTDKTAEQALEAGAEVIHIDKKGVGTAMCAGFKKATGNIIVTSDGDGTYPLGYLPNLLGTMYELDLGFLSTNRLQFMHNGAMSKRNKLGNKLLSFVLRVLFGKGIQDSQSGMMLIRKELLDKMKLHPNISVPQEMKIEASYYLKSRWAEVPINYYERLGESKLMKGYKGWKVGVNNMTNLLRKRIYR